MTDAVFTQTTSQSPILLLSTCDRLCSIFKAEVLALLIATAGQAQEDHLLHSLTLRPESDHI